jgi:uncharacterized membrane protein
LGAVPGVGGLLGSLFGIVLGALLIFGIPIIAKEGLDFWPASKKSIDTVKPQLVQFSVFAFVLGLCSALGVILFGIGIFLTLPLYPCTIAVVYREIFPKQETA